VETLAKQKSDVKMSNENYQMLFEFNPAIFRVLLKYLKPENNEKILEIGCSRGYYLREIEKYTKEVIGIDISKVALKNTVTEKAIHGDALNLNFGENTFDKIYSLHTVEHIPDLKKFFLGINKVLKSGGIAVIIYPWEPIRGIQVIGTALMRYKNPLIMRKIHLHKLDPKKIEELIKNTQLSHIESKLVFALGIHYITVLKKIE